jgi:hypothetical protein
MRNGRARQTPKNDRLPHGIEGSLADSFEDGFEKGLNG